MSLVRHAAATLLLALALALALASATGATAQATPGCERCHGELELLRQQSGSLERARALLVPAAAVAGSAHAGMACAACHSGFQRFPHVDGRTATRTCRGCHAAADSAWLRGAHAGTEGGDPVACVQCHGSHDIRPAGALARGGGAAQLNARCEACHAGVALPASDPHAGDVGCYACHGAHDVRLADVAGSTLAPDRQAATCGACHEEPARRWLADAHGAAMATAGSSGHERRGAVCSDCHGGHGIVATDSVAFGVASTETCASCHEHAARTFFGSYHGKATALGSRVSATCADCHGAHGVYAKDDGRSTVAVGNLVSTCKTCHEHARPAFVAYDSHPDPLNRERNPWLFYSFVFMNVLLVGVLAVFGLHTLLWWVRLKLDARKGGGHGHGH